jgi:ATP-dependent protease ClpP protease subunit
MSLRSLPEMRRPERVDCSFSLSDKAVKLYRPLAAPTAAASDNTISVLDVIGYDWWTGEGVTAKRIGAALRSIGEKPVTVLINSPGGDFFEGVTIYNMLREHPAQVTVKILGLAASAASVIAMAADRIEIASLGFFMVHNTQWVASGDRHVMKETHDIMQVFDEACADMFAKRTGKDAAEIGAMLDAETWLAGQKAVEEGFADVVTDIDTEDKLQNQAPALYRMEALLAAGKPVPRSEVRKLMKEISEGMPGAANGHAMPGAGEPAAEDSSTHLSLALARMKLARA